MQWLDLKVPPVLVWLVFAGAMFGEAYVAPEISYPLPARFALALALVVLGGAVALAGVVAFRSKRTTVNPLTPGAVLLLPGFLACLTQYQIKPEERALLAKIGPAFAQYMARVRR
jgi:hypothetical protein